MNVHGDGADDDRPKLWGDQDLVDQLTLLGRALGHPIRVRIAAALLRLDQAGPNDLAQLIDETRGNVSYHVRYLHHLGFLKLERLIPRPEAVEDKYSLEDPLRRALPAAALALGRDGSGAATETPSETRDVIASDRRIFVQIGRALSDEDRIEILGYLLRHDHATPTQIAEGLQVSRAAVGQHLRVLAGNHMVALTPTPTLRGHWTVTQPMKKALAGLYDLLVRVRQGRPADVTTGTDRDDCEGRRD